MALVQQSSVNHNYASRASRPDVDFDKLMPGAKSSEGKVWQHELVESGGGGWYEADDPALKKASLPLPEEPAAEAAPAAAAGDSGGGTYDPSAIGGLAMGGLQQAREVEGARSLPMPGAINPLLGQRIYPMAMRQLSQAGGGFY